MQETVIRIMIDNNIIMFIALYGALISTIVLLWDIYKWKNSGPKIIGKIKTNMIGIDDLKYKNENLILVTISNIGDKPTTVTSLTLSFYNSAISKILKISKNHYWVETPSYSNPTPYLLRSGSEWTGIVVQNEKFEKLSKTGILICSIHFSHTKKCTDFRVKIK